MVTTSLMSSISCGAQGVAAGYRAGDPGGASLGAAPQPLRAGECVDPGPSDKVSLAISCLIVCSDLAGAAWL